MDGEGCHQDGAANGRLEERDAGNPSRLRHGARRARRPPHERVVIAAFQACRDAVTRPTDCLLGGARSVSSEVLAEAANPPDFSKA